MYKVNFRAMWNLSIGGAILYSCGGLLAFQCVLWQDLVLVIENKFRHIFFMFFMFMNLVGYTLYITI